MLKRLLRLPVFLTLVVPTAGNRHREHRKIIARKNAARFYPVARENAEYLAADFIV